MDFCIQDLRPFDGITTEWIQKAAEIYGFTWKRRGVGQNFIQPDYRKLFGHVLHAALDGKETANCEFSEAKHGETFTVLLNADTRRDAEAALTGAMGGGQDIAELNQVLAESKRVVVKRMRAAASARRALQKGPSQVQDLLLLDATPFDHVSRSPRQAGRAGGALRRDRRAKFVTPADSSFR